MAKGLKSFHAAVPFVTMGTLAMVSGIVMCWLPETRGKPTAETNNDKQHAINEMLTPLDGT